MKLIELLQQYYEEKIEIFEAKFKKFEKLIIDQYVNRSIDKQMLRIKFDRIINGHLDMLNEILQVQ